MQRAIEAVHGLMILPAPSDARARNRYRECLPQLGKAIGRKVQGLIDEHIISLGIDSKITLIVITERRVGVEAGNVDVSDLGYRWGSCGKADRLYSHRRTILPPPRIIEFVTSSGSPNMRAKRS